MKKLAFLVLTVLCFSVVTVASDDDVTVLTASLRGADEVPAINSNGSATFRAVIHEDGTITFTETFKNLTSDAIFSHIHFGEVHVAGGVMIFLCGGIKPACPAAASGSFSGTIAPSDVVGPTTQGVTPGDLASALRAIRQGAAYVNLHSMKFPGGEIRGQVIVHHGDEEGGDK